MQKWMHFIKRQHISPAFQTTCKSEIRKNQKNCHSQKHCGWTDQGRTYTSFGWSSNGSLVHHDLLRCL